MKMKDTEILDNILKMEVDDPKILEYITKLEDIQILKYLQVKLKWSHETLKANRTAVKSYTNFHDKSLANLLKEAEEDENVKWKKRKLRARLLNYRAYLYENYIVKSAKTYMQRIKYIYRNFEIELRELPPISEINAKHNPPIYFEDLPTKELIKASCNVSDPRITAIILFMASSGSAKKETLSLTVKDFIESTQYYHNIEIDEECTPQEILDKVIRKLIATKEKIYPNFKITRKKTNNYYITHCTDEATRAILNYLLTRKDTVTCASPLFKIHENYVHIKFQEINEKLQIPKVSNRSKFRSHMLRKFHASTLNKSIKKDGKRQNGMKKKYIDALQGRGKFGTDKSYFFDDYEELREEYIHFADRLQIYNNKDEDDFKTKQYLDLEKNMKKELAEKNKVISNIAHENIQLKKNNEKFDERLTKLEKDKNLIPQEILEKLEKLKELDKIG